MIKTILSEMDIIETLEMLQSVTIEDDSIKSLKALMHDFGKYR